MATKKTVGQYDKQLVVRVECDPTDGGRGDEIELEHVIFSYSSGNEEISRLVEFVCEDSDHFSVRDFIDPPSADTIEEARTLVGEIWSAYEDGVENEDNENDDDEDESD